MPFFQNVSKNSRSVPSCAIKRRKVIFTGHSPAGTSFFYESRTKCITTSSQPTNDREKAAEKRGARRSLSEKEAIVPGLDLEMQEIKQSLTIRSTY